MNVGRAREIAREWVAESAARISTFDGAYFAGSATWLPEDAELLATSDIDVTLVSATAELPEKPGKVAFQDVVIDAYWAPATDFGSPERILGDYHLAGAFRTPSVIADRTGELTRLNEAVAKEFATRTWVVARCENARSNILSGLSRLDASQPFHDQVITWLFPTGVTTHVLLVAGLRNPTVRQRYVAVRALLDDYGRLDFHERLLEMQGSADMSRARVEHHLQALASVFDAVAGLVRSPFPFASDISGFARPIAIDGSRDLIARGRHREAIFWIVATYSRCLAVIATDAPHLEQAGFDQGYRDLLDDLGITSSNALRQRGDAVRAFLPEVWEVAEQIIAANPGIRA